MNRKPDTALRFAVNRADMLSRLPGVHPSAVTKRFVRGKPKLSTIEPSHAPMHTPEMTWRTPSQGRRDLVS